MAKENEKNRERNIQKKFWVSEEENELLKKKMELTGCDNFNEYIVRMGIDGFIIVQDYENLIEVSKLITDIGADINKIAHRCDLIEIYEERIKAGEVVSDPIPQISIADIQKIDSHMEKIWDTLNMMVKSQSASSVSEKVRKDLKRE